MGVFDFSFEQGESTSIAEVLKALNEAGVEIRDLHSQESSLENLRRACSLRQSWTLI